MPPCDRIVLTYDLINDVVSILVLVDAALRPCIRGLPLMVSRVSILVLVDAALRLYSTRYGQSLQCCFNPCFSGCRPATGCQSGECILVATVSILVLVDAALRRCFCRVVPSFILYFNPCFSGCRPATIHLGNTLRETERSFNPCFSGCRPATL